MNRRMFLRSASATLWLPLLPSALPRSAWAASGSAPRRIVYWFVPNGLHYKALIPDEDQFSSMVLQPLGPVWGRVSQISSLRNMAVANYGSHEAGTSSALTDVSIQLGGAIEAGISVDQVAAEAVGANTPIPSLQLGLDEPGLLNGGNSGIYTNHISWGRNSRPLTKITSPRRLFSRMFSGSDPVATDTRKELRKSVLDAVLERANDLHRGLATDDQRKLDQYISSVRQVEEQIDALEEFTCPLPEAPSGDYDFAKTYRAMADLTILALQCDYSRIISFMSGPSVAYTVYRHLGHSTDHHTLSHATQSDGIQQLMEIHRWHVEQMAITMDKMQEIPEGGGDLLSNTALTLMTEFGEPNVHYAGDMTYLLAGGEGGGIVQGRHRDARGQPHSNYHRAMLEFMGVNSIRFGPHATGTFDLT